MHKIQQCKFTFQESLDSKTISGYAISILTLSSPFKYAHISFLSRMETPGTRALFQDIPESRIMLKGLQDFVRSSDALSIRFSFFLSIFFQKAVRQGYWRCPLGWILLSASAASNLLKFGQDPPEVGRCRPGDPSFLRSLWSSLIALRNNADHSCNSNVGMLISG